MLKKMYIKTVYGPDVSGYWPAPYLPLTEGKNLRKRINFTERNADGNPATTADQVRTRYSYDLHGNVESVVSEIAAEEADFPAPYEIFHVRTDYQYDLIIGKATEINYRHGYNDSYNHSYTYDEDQRVSEYESSRYRRIWDGDARYQYNAHGPLKRMELGEDMVQGVDYTYTILS